MFSYYEANNFKIRERLRSEKMSGITSATLMTTLVTSSISGFIQGALTPLVGFALSPFLNLAKTKGWEDLFINREIVQSYCKDLTSYYKEIVKDKEKKDDEDVEILGRDIEIDKVIEILTRDERNNACILGNPGVGKTALVYGLAKRIAEGKVPDSLKDSKIMMLDMVSLISGKNTTDDINGAVRRLKVVMDEAVKKKYILCIDEMHQITKFAELFKSALGGDVSGNGKEIPVKIIGTTTTAEWNLINDPPLLRRFDTVDLKEQSPEITLKILKNRAKKIKKKDKIEVTEKAMNSIITLSQRFMRDKTFPDKSISLMNLAVSKAKVNGKKIVNDSDIEVMMSEKLRIPVTKIVKEEHEKLAKLHEKFSEVIVGQDEAVKKVCDALRRFREDLNNPERPIATFMFTGTSGVGKTELAKVLAKEVGSHVYINLLHYKDANAVNELLSHKLQGKGELLHSVSENKYSVVIFDNIEETNAGVLDLISDICEKGEVKDQFGKSIDFRNTIIVATTYIGAEEILATPEGQDYKMRALEKIQTVYGKASPKFLINMDDVIVFNKLNTGDLRKITETHVNRLKTKFKEKFNLKLNVSDDIINVISQIGNNTTQGVRYLSKIIERSIELPIDEMILNKQINKGQELECKIVDGDLKFEIKEYNQKENLAKAS